MNVILQVMSECVARKHFTPVLALKMACFSSVSLMNLGEVEHRRRNRGRAGHRGHVPPKFSNVIYKLLTTLCVVTNCAPPPNQKVFSMPL